MDRLDQRIRLGIDVELNESRWWATAPSTETLTTQMVWSWHRHLAHAGLVESTSGTPSSSITWSVAERLLLCISRAVDDIVGGANFAVQEASKVAAPTSAANTAVSLELILPADEAWWRGIPYSETEPMSLAERVCAYVTKTIETCSSFVAVQAGITAIVIPDDGHHR